MTHDELRRLAGEIGELRLSRAEFADEAQALRDRLERSGDAFRERARQVERVRKLHYPTVEMGEQEFCENCCHAWPCPTISALDGDTDE